MAAGLCQEDSTGRLHNVWKPLLYMLCPPDRTTRQSQSARHLAAKPKLVETVRRHIVTRSLEPTAAQRTQPAREAANAHCNADHGRGTHGGTGARIEPSDYERERAASQPGNQGHQLGRTHTEDHAQIAEQPSRSQQCDARHRVQLAGDDLQLYRRT